MKNKEDIYEKMCILLVGIVIGTCITLKGLSY